MFGNAKRLFFKILIIIVFILLILSVNNLIALYFGIRPQTVITYSIIGAVVSYSALQFYDKFIEKKEDPLPEYVLRKVDLQRQELDILEEFISEHYNITPEELKVRAKTREYVEYNEKEQTGSIRS